MKTIGLVDYYVSEWHANHYPAWIQEQSQKAGTGFCVKYAWAETYRSPVDGRSTDEWCRDFGVERCETIDELCRKCAYILILAPSNPEKHPAYAQAVLKYGKHTYIDKTFAPGYDEAQAIFDMAAQYGTKCFSSSALRYASELHGLEDCRAVITTGGGDSFDEYIIHQVEMIVKTIAQKPKAVRVEKQGSQYIGSVLFENGRKAAMAYAPPYPFTIQADTSRHESVFREIRSDFFKALITDILHFFETGNISFDISQTLDVMRIRSALIQSKRRPGEWHSL